MYVSHARQRPVVDDTDDQPAAAAAAAAEAQAHQATDEQQMSPSAV